jgi:hypothetical protein
LGPKTTPSGRKQHPQASLRSVPKDNEHGFNPGPSKNPPMLLEPVNWRRGTKMQTLSWTYTIKARRRTGLTVKKDERRSPPASPVASNGSGGGGHPCRPTTTAAAPTQHAGDRATRAATTPQSRGPCRPAQAHIDLGCHGRPTPRVATMTTCPSAPPSRALHAPPPHAVAR